MPSRAYLGRFNFKGNDQQKLVGNLSGGERGRLHLAKTLIAGGNVLMLDEPSNDLDVETLRALEDALLEFAGSMHGDQPRPLVPRPHRHPHPGLPRATRSGCSSTATTRSTRPTRRSASARKAPRPQRAALQGAEISSHERAGTETCDSDREPVAPPSSRQNAAVRLHSRQRLRAGRARMVFRCPRALAASSRACRRSVRLRLLSRPSPPLRAAAAGRRAARRRRGRRPPRLRPPRPRRPAARRLAAAAPSRAAPVRRGDQGTPSASTACSRSGRSDDKVWLELQPGRPRTSRSSCRRSSRPASARRACLRRPDGATAAGHRSSAAFTTRCR